MSLTDHGLEKMAEAQMTGSPMRLTRRQQLELRRRNLQSDLDAVNKALGALDDHPELEEFIETLAKAGA